MKQVRSYSTPVLRSPDPSLYLSPFSQSAQSILVDSTVHSKSPVPTFVRDAPESFVWHVTIYKDGAQVDPRFEAELKSFSWVNLVTSWSQTKLTKSQLVTICQDLFELTNKDDNAKQEVNSENVFQHSDAATFRAKHFLSDRADYISSSHISLIRTIPQSITIPRSTTLSTPRPTATESVYCVDTDSDTDTSSPDMMGVESTIETKDHTITLEEKITDNYQNVPPPNLEGQFEFCSVGC